MKRYAVGIINIGFLLLVLVTAATLSVSKDAAPSERKTSASKTPKPAKKATKATRYFCGNTYGGAILEIDGDRYKESYKTCLDDEPTVLSQGRCERNGDSLKFFEDGSGEEWEANTSTQSIHFTETERKLSLWRKTTLSWSDLLSKGSIPYSVDGISLGWTLEQVEDSWGELKQTPERLRRFERFENREQSIELDRFGRVRSIWGTTLLKNRNQILSLDNNFEDAFQIGEKSDFRNSCGYVPRFVRGYTRFLEGCRFRVIGLVEEDYAKDDPESLQGFKKAGIDFNRIQGIELELSWPDME